MATSSEVAYLSTDRLYLATNPWGDDSVGWWGGLRRVLPGIGGREDGETVLHSFALDGLDTTYVATGTVEGWIQDRWAMDSAEGVLRLAVSPTSQTGNFNSVIMLAERGTALVEQGRADKLGVNEEIKSVRWFDDLAIVVTFRQTDPLYAIDLADPSEPRVLGKLKIPGFSEYLHPVGSSQLIGIGQNADEKTGQTLGAQAALFDISDLTDPLRLDVVTYRKNSWAGAANDPRQFTWLPDSRTALTVVAQGWQGTTGWVSTLRVDGDTLRNEMVAVEYGSDVAKVRLVPLPSGKVVLVTGEDVSFFPLTR